MLSLAPLSITVNQQSTVSVQSGASGSGIREDVGDKRGREKDDTSPRKKLRTKDSPAKGMVHSERVELVESLEALPESHPASTVLVSSHNRRINAIPPETPDTLMPKAAADSIDASIHQIPHNTTSLASQPLSLWFFLPILASFKVAVDLNCWPDEAIMRVDANETPFTEIGSGLCGVVQRINNMVIKAVPVEISKNDDFGFYEEYQAKEREEKHEDAVDCMENESMMYAGPLKLLQGSVVPKCHYHDAALDWGNGKMCHTLILQYCGYNLEEFMDALLATSWYQKEASSRTFSFNKTKQRNQVVLLQSPNCIGCAVLRTLAQLHSHGILQGDMRRGYNFSIYFTSATKLSPVSKPCKSEPSFLTSEIQLDDSHRFITDLSDFPDTYQCPRNKAIQNWLEVLHQNNATEELRPHITILDFGFASTIETSEDFHEMLKEYLRAVYQFQFNHSCGHSDEIEIRTRMRFDIFAKQIDAGSDMKSLLQQMLQLHTPIRSEQAVDEPITNMREENVMKDITSNS